MTSSPFFTRNRLTFFVVIFTSCWVAAIVLYSCSDKPKISDESVTASPNHPSGPLTDADYVGSESCKSCHETEFKDWEGSQHDKAMMEADANSVLADFNTTFTNQGVTSRF